MGRRLKRALADTSYFITSGEEREVPVDQAYELAVSVITIGELRAGVLLADDPATTARRLRALNAAELLDPLPIDERVADAWSELRVTMRRQERRRLRASDSWIAATAIANGLPILTLDSDFADVPGLDVVTF